MILEILTFLKSDNNASFLRFPGTYLRFFVHFLLSASINPHSKGVRYRKEERPLITPPLLEELKKLFEYTDRRMKLNHKISEIALLR